MASIALGLSKWYAALATGTAQAVVIGDSISEGTGASSIPERWQTLVQETLSPAGAQFPFIPAWPYTSAPGMPVSRSGSVSNGSQFARVWGLGWRAAEINGDDGVLTFTFSGTSAQVVFQRGATTGLMQVVVDGGAPVVVDTNSAAGTPTGGKADRWSTGPLASGNHTVVVRRQLGSPQPSVWVHGLHAFRGDEASGVRVIDGARHGLYSNFAMEDTRRLPSFFGDPATPSGTPGAMQTAGGADLIVYALGTNDLGGAGAATPARYAEVFRAYKAAARGYTPAPFEGSFLILGMYSIPGRDPAVWDAYHQAMRGLAAEDPDVAYLDLRPVIPPEEASALLRDGLHPNDAGYARLAGVIGSAMAGTLVEISASLVESAGSPPPVQVVIDGVLPGYEYVVTGSTGGGSSWPVPGGKGVGTGGQIVLVDNRSALNTPVTYSVVVQGVTYSADPVTVVHDGQAVLQSLDGGTAVDFVWLSNSLPREPQINAVTFNVPGRRRPPVRYAPGGDGGGELLIRADRANNAAIGALLQSGRPILVRTDGTMRDWLAVELILLVGAPSRLWEAVEGGELSTQRVWNLSFLYVDDPEPSRVLSAWTWDDFDQAAETSFDTWDEFDALFAGSTWDDFDTTDWGQYQ